MRALDPQWPREKEVSGSQADVNFQPGRHFFIFRAAGLRARLLSCSGRLGLRYLHGGVQEHGL